MYVIQVQNINNSKCNRLSVGAWLHMKLHINSYYSFNSKGTCTHLLGLVLLSKLLVSDRFCFSDRQGNLMVEIISWRRP